MMIGNIPLRRLRLHLCLLQGKNGVRDVHHPSPVSVSQGPSEFLHANVASRQEITKGSRPQTPRPRRDGPFSSIWHGVLVLPYSETCSPLKGATLVVLPQLWAAIVMSDLGDNLKSRGRTVRILPSD